MEKVVREGSIKLAQLAESLGIRNLDPDCGKIFITGGTGVVGHRVANRFLKDGYADIRLGSHRPETLDEMKWLGADVVEFNWDDEKTYEKALEGVKSVLCVIVYHENWEKHFPVFLEACKKAGVRHLIKLSFYHARLGDEFAEVPLVKAHGECDQMLIDALTPKVDSTFEADTEVAVDFGTPHMSYTILYASHFMSNPFAFQGEELFDDKKPVTYYGASGNRGVNYVSPNDVAEVAVRILLNPREHYNREYTLTGPKAVTDQEVAGFISKRLNKPVMYVEQPLHTFKSQLKLLGDPEWMVDDLAALEKIKGSGSEESRTFVSRDIEKICGHKPEDFEGYLGEPETMTTIELGHELVVTPEG